MMNIERKPFGKTARGEAVTLFEIRTPELTARILDYLDCSMDFLMGRTVDPAVQRMELTDEERQKVTDFLQFILSQRK